MDIQAKTYFLLGYYGRGNVGDDAILSSFLSRFSSDASFLILPPKKRPLPVFRLLRSFFLTLRSDGLILVGGNLLQNRSSHRSLFFYLSVVRFAEMLGKSVTIFGGIGEITGKRAAERTGNALSRAEVLYLRSHNDQKIAEGLIAEIERKPKIFYVPDPVLFLPAVPKKQRTFAVLILKRTKDKNAHPALVSRFSPGFSLVLSGLAEEDRPYLSDLSRCLSLPLVLPEDAGEMLSLLQNAAVSVSERYHGGIFSLLSQTPCFLCTDAQKCEGLVMDVREAAKKTGAALPLFGYGKDVFYAPEHSPSDRATDSPPSVRGEDRPPFDEGLSFSSFLRKKIGDISASDFEKVVSYLQKTSADIRLP